MKGPEQEGKVQTWSWWSLPVQQWLAECPAVYRVSPCARLLPIFPSHCVVHEDSTHDDDGEAEKSSVTCSSLTARSDHSGSESRPLRSWPAAL